MKIAKVLTLLGLMAMTGILIYGFTVGNFSSEGAKLVAMPWGILSIVDLYVDFSLFSCWIVFREKAVLPSVIWVILMMVLGFQPGGLYTFSFLCKQAAGNGSASGTESGHRLDETQNHFRSIKPWASCTW